MGAGTFPFMAKRPKRPAVAWLDEVRAQHAELERMWAEQKLNPPTPEERLSALESLTKSLALTPKKTGNWLRDIDVAWHGPRPRRAK